jgi:tRNA threonylcarbamoyladenosine biosynthesis protein TsaB
VDVARADAGAAPVSAAEGRADDRWTVALDTATPATVVGVAAPDGREAARIATPEPGERPGHARLLLELAAEALAETGGDWRSVGRVVIGLGPGTFTGIRIGVATGRAVALAAGATMVGVPTPAALATAAQAPGGPAEGRRVLVVQDARRREFFLSSVAPGELPGGAAALRPWTVAQDALGEAVAALSSRPAVAVGDGALSHRAVLEALGVLVPEDPTRHAVDGLALIAAATATPPTDAADLRPVYVRDADAVPTAQRS